MTLWERFQFWLAIRPAFVIFFLVGIVAAVPLLYYYRKRNPNPRFRPSGGEMTLVSIMATGASAALAFGISAVFDSEQSLRRLDSAAEDMDPAYSEIRNQGGRSRKDSKEEKDPAKENVFRK